MNYFQAVVIAFAALAAVSEVHGFRVECPMMCPTLFQPICATDGQEYLRFNNLCGLKVFNCQQQRSSLSTYVKTDFDFCSTTNLDEVEMDLLSDSDKGDKSCQRPCQMIYRPVCGSNGIYRKSFSNECVMDSFGCMFKTNNKNDWRILREGQC